MPLADYGIADDEVFVVEDLITGERFSWCGSRNFVSLNPHTRPAHIFRIRRWQDRENGQDIFA